MEGDECGDCVGIGFKAIDWIGLVIAISMLPVFKLKWLQLGCSSILIRGMLQWG